MRGSIGRSWVYPELNRWHFVMRLGPIPWRRCDSYRFDFGFFKVTSYPPEGEVIQRHHYEGFKLGFEFGLPEIGWSYNFPDKRYFVGMDVGTKDGDKTAMVIASQNSSDGKITIESVEFKEEK